MDEIEKVFRPHEIIPNLFLGSEEEAELAGRSGKFDEIIDVRYYLPGMSIDPIDRPEGYGLVDPVALGAYANIIHDLLVAGKKIFVHCKAGMERSPLVVAWYLVLYEPFPDLETAYRFIIDKHPLAQRRDMWVRWNERDKRGMFGKKNVKKCQE